MTDFPQFTPTEFYDAKAKLRFAKHFVRFIESGFDRDYFKPWFYRILSNCFGHIAHFNEDGFYAAQFGNKRRQLAFLKHTSDWVCYGDPKFTFSDVERALKVWVYSSGLIEKLIAEIAADTEASERAQLARLKEKYEGAT